MACGFGTAYEGLAKIGISGNDAVLITGLGPVGLASAALCRKLGASRIFGIDVLPERLQLARDLHLVDEALPSGPDNVREIQALTDGHGVERAVDCSGNGQARATAVRATRKWGRIVLMGERLLRWRLYPEQLVTHRFSLDRVGEAYALMASGRCGKVAICFDEELR